MNNIFNYNETEKEIYILGFLDDNNSVDDLLIPSTINNKPVTKIEDGAFENKNIRKVFVPFTIKSIGKDAFKNNKIMTLTIEDGVEIIDDFAFANNKLEKIDIPDNVKFIGDGAFCGNHIVKSKVKIKNKLLIKNSFDFSLNKNYQVAFSPLHFVIEIKEDNSICIKGFSINYVYDLDLEIPDTIHFDGVTYDVTEIGECAFKDKKLNSVKIGKNIKRIDAFAFYGNNFDDVILPDGLEFIDFKAFGNNNLKEIKIPDKIKASAHII